MRNVLVLMLTALVLMLTALVMMSCDSFKVTYNVDIVGDVEGIANVTFPDGVLDVEGNAKLDFHYGNVPEVVSSFTITEAVKSGDKKALKAAQKIVMDFPDQFSAYAVDGTYYLRVLGVAEAYGVKITIDETLTNRKNE